MWSHTIAIIVVFAVCPSCSKIFEHKNIATYTAARQRQRRLLLCIRPNTNETNMTKSNCDKNVASGMAFETIVVHSVLCYADVDLVESPFSFFPRLYNIIQISCYMQPDTTGLWWMKFTHSQKQKRTRTHKRMVHVELASSTFSIIKKWFSNEIHTKVFMYE